MSKKLFFGTIVVLLIVTGLAVWTLWSGDDVKPGPGSGGTDFPPGHEFPDTIPETETMTLPLQSGSLEVENFLGKSDVFTDGQNPGYYYLGKNSLPDAQTAQYSIFYIAQSGYFNITLLQKPLGQARLAAEIDLMQRLGLNKEEMCALRYSVSVPGFVDDEYTSQELGFSFCEGRVDLP